MKSYRYDSSAPLSGAPNAALGLRLEDTAPAEPGPGQVRVAVRARSLNFVDLVSLSGAFPVAGLVPLLDGAGEILAVGQGVTAWKAGDRIVANPQVNWLAGKPSPDSSGVVLGCTTDGTLAEQMILPERALARLPQGMSFEHAASLPCAGLSAWNSLMGGPTLQATQPGETVLVQGTGGVSLFALQFAKAMNCRVIATTSTAEKTARLTAMGADAVINYVERPNWADDVLALTDGAGVDLVVEVGGPNTLPQSVKSAKIGGRIALIGIVAGLGQIDYVHLLPVNHKVLSIFANGMGNRRDLEAMLRLVDQARIPPITDRVFAFAEAEDAFRHFANRRHVGKVVIA